MDRDSFIIAVFLLGCEQYSIIKKQYRPRRGGFEPALTDEEVITMEICGEYFKLECGKDIFAYFHTHYLHFFLKFAAKLWRIKGAVQKNLTIISGQFNDHVQEIDTLPLPVCALARAGRDHRFPAEDDF